MARWVSGMQRAAFRVSLRKKIGLLAPKYFLQCPRLQQISVNWIFLTQDSVLVNSSTKLFRAQPAMDLAATGRAPTSGSVGAWPVSRGDSRRGGIGRWESQLRTTPRQLPAPGRRHAWPIAHPGRGTPHPRALTDERTGMSHVGYGGAVTTCRIKRRLPCRFHPSIRTRPALRTCSP